LIIILSLTSGLHAQEVDSLMDEQTRVQQAIVDSPVDSVAPVKQKPKRIKNFFRKQFVNDYPNPRKALILGLVIPGAGQAYNGSFWKVPLVVGGIGTAIYNIGTNRRNRDLFVTAYKIRVDGDDSTIDQFADIFTQDSRLKTIRDEFIKQHELAWITLVGVGILSAAEAFVDAHLKTFDISDDLSFRPKFKLGTDQFSGTYVGMGIAFQIR